MSGGCRSLPGQALTVATAAGPRAGAAQARSLRPANAFFQYLQEGSANVPNSVFQTLVNHEPQDFAENTRRLVDLLTEIKHDEERIRQDGGTKAIEAQHAKGRLTARERVAGLADPGRHVRARGL